MHKRLQQSGNDSLDSSHDSEVLISFFHSFFLLDFSFSFQPVFCSFSPYLSSLCHLPSIITFLLQASSEQLTAAERASEALEESMTQHMSLWDELCDSVDQHQTIVSAMQDKHTELVAEIHEREARVLQLEALLQAGDVSNASGTRTLKELSASVIMLKAELAKTKEEARQSQEEVGSWCCD